MIDEDSVRERNASLSPHLDERGRRLFAASEAKAAGYGWIAAVSRITGRAASTIGRGLKDLSVPLEEGRVRRRGGGRKPLIEIEPKLLDDLNALVEPAARGDPMSPLRWTSKSLRKLAAELRELGHKISHTLVGELLKRLGFSLQANRKTREGDSHPDRDAQFCYINAQVAAALAENEPVISVDTKKKELVGDFKNAGREWHPEGNPEEVRVHDFLIKELGRAVPYGVYDLAADKGWINVGIDHDTAAFAVATIRRWWQEAGRIRYLTASRLLITADGGGSNGSRVRLWKYELQRLADEIGVTIEVHHFPPGTSKWNKIEHRLFSHISMNWRGKPLTSHEVIVNLISSTKTRTGLKVKCALDTNKYPTGIKVTDKELQQVKIFRYQFHGEWNYRINPNPSQKVKVIY